MRILEAIKKNYLTLKEAANIKSKISVIIYIFTYPVTKLIRAINNNFMTNFYYNVTLKNKDGIFFCGKDVSYALVGISNFEENIKEKFNLKEGVFVDIGAHFGKHSIMVGKKLKGKVISIEPNKKILIFFV